MSAAPASRYIVGNVTYYALCIVLAITAALFVCLKEEKRLGLPQDTMLDCALWAIPLGIIGARLYYVIFEFDSFRDNLVSILYIWEGGLAIYGGIIGGVIGVLIVARRRKLNILLLLDILGPAVVLAQGIGRWGNYFNMEAYGLPIYNEALQFFPFGVLINNINSINGNTWHQATFFYEFVWDIAVFVILMVFRRYRKRTGDVFLWYILLYGAGRAVIEGLRMDSLIIGGIRISQWLSIGACIVICVMFLMRMLSQRKRPFEKSYFNAFRNPFHVAFVSAFAALLFSLYNLFIIWQQGVLNIDAMAYTVMVMILLTGIIWPVLRRAARPRGALMVIIVFLAQAGTGFLFGGEYSQGVHTLQIALLALGLVGIALWVYSLCEVDVKEQK